MFCHVLIMTVFTVFHDLPHAFEPHPNMAVQSFIPTEDVIFPLRHRKYCPQVFQKDEREHKANGDVSEMYFYHLTVGQKWLNNVRKLQQAVHLQPTMDFIVDFCLVLQRRIQPVHPVFEIHDAKRVLHGALKETGRISRTWQTHDAITPLPCTCFFFIATCHP